MWIFCNPNPCNLLVGDCVVRACSISQDKSWTTVHSELSDLSRAQCNMPSANIIWGQYLERNMSYREPRHPITVRQFCLIHPYGVYTIGTGSHAVSVIDGDELVSYYFERS